MSQPQAGVTPSAQVPGRRERKKQATRTALREAALRLAVRHGVKNVTVEQIAAEADLALRTFFNHFSSKEEAVLAAAAAGAEALVEKFRARPPHESVLRAVREAVLVVVDRDDAVGRDHIRVLRLMQHTPALLPQQMAVLIAQEKALADAIAERLAAADPADPPGIYPQLCATATLATLRVVLARWLSRTADTDEIPTSATLREEVDEALSHLAAGLDRPGTRDSSGAPR